MTTKTICILGASRGLGLGLTKQFLERGWHVTASERSTSEGLHALEGNALKIVTVDVTDPDSYAGLDFANGSLDALFVNAGITGARHQSSEQATPDEVAEVMMTNAFGPVRAAKTLLPAVKDGGTLGFMTSLMGSIDDSSGGYELYRSSKAALNMLAKGVAEQDAKPRNIEVLAMHPGWVETDMGGPQAPLSVDESTKGIADVIEGSGGGGFRFVDYTGKELAF